MKKTRILSLDGGGIRGIIPAIIVQYIEEEIQRKTENPNARIADYFDLIAGTSTGGILTCFYLCPNPDTSSPVSTKFSAAKAIEFYEKEGMNIFNNSKYKTWFGTRQLFNAVKYNPKALEGIFEENFGDLKMRELIKPCIVTTYDMKEKSTHFFSSVEPANKQREFYVKDVARSTSAAPTYFPPAFIKNLSTGKQMINIDGGVFANNPTMCAYAEARFLDVLGNPTAKDMLILSIGTGGGAFDLPDVQKSKKWGVLSWATSAPEIMMDGDTDTVSTQMDYIFDSLERHHHHNYLRIDVPKSLRNYSRDMANASEGNIQQLKAAGKATLEHFKSKTDTKIGLDLFIDKLISIENNNL